MALDVSSTAAVNSAANALSEASTAYGTSLTDLETAVKATETLWVGADADAYRKKIYDALAEGAVFQQVKSQISSHSSFLSTAASELKAAQDKIQAAMQG